MNDWVAASILGEKRELEEFESSLLSAARSDMEKNAGELTEYIDLLFENGNTAPRLDRLEKQTKVAEHMGRELAKEAGIAGTIMGAVKPLASKALGYAAAHPQRAMAIGGAAVGGLAGAARAQPGQRLSGAVGGAALGGAAGYGASKLPGGLGQRAMDYTSGLASRGLSKLALAGGLGRVGVGALAGAAVGALHKSPAEQQGLAPGHHLRNALIGAAGGAALGRAASPSMVGKAEGAIAHAPLSAGHSPYLSPSVSPPPGWGHGHTPADLQHMSRVKAMANSPEAASAMRARGLAAGQAHMRANPELYNPVAKAAPNVTAAGRRQAPAPINPMGATMAKMAARGGREFIKRAFSMSAQAEPGTDTGAQEPEAEAQSLSRPQRVSLPAAQLYDSLKHLSPRNMRGLQVAQPGA